jgi:hypothetical protein
MSIGFMDDFDMRALMGHGDVDCFRYKLYRLPSGSYWKHRVSSPVTIFAQKLFANCIETSQFTSTRWDADTLVLSAVQLPYNLR